MQSVSSTLRTAIESRDRFPICRVKIDWQRNGYGADGSIDDITPDVTSIDLKRSLTTDVPAGTRAFRRAVFSGNVAANATIELAHKDPTDPNKHAAWYYSPYNSASPLFGFKRLNAPCTIEIGFRTTAGKEYVTVLVGNVRRLQVSSQLRTATLEVVDLSEGLRKSITLPQFVADDMEVTTAAEKPGLRSCYIADTVLRKCGYFASPPKRVNCVLLATLHGSGYPEDPPTGAGTGIVTFRGANFSQLAFPPADFSFQTPAKFVAGVDLNGDTGQLVDYGAGPWTVDTGGRLLVEGWFYLRDYVGGLNHGAGLWTAFRNGQSEPHVSAWVNSTGLLSVNIDRGVPGGAGGDNSSGIMGGVTLNTWHYIGMYFEFNASNVSIWGRVDGTTATASNISVNHSTGVQCNEIQFGRAVSAGSLAETRFNGIIEAVQVTTVNAGGVSPGWNDGFVPTSIVMAGKNALAANPPTKSEEAWGILQEVAKAENAIVGFTETGTPYFRDRSFFSIPPQTVSQKTVTSLTNITELDTDESTDSIRNHIVLHAAVPVIQGKGDIWALASIWSIPGNSTKTFFAVYENPAGDVDVSVQYGTGIPASRYLACRTRDGSGAAVSNLSFTVTPFVDTAKIVIHNPNAFTAFLCGASGAVGGSEVGKPTFALYGLRVFWNDPAQLNAKQRQEASDTTSMNTYGEQLYQERAEDNLWVQDQESLGQRATDLLAQLKDGKPSIQNLRIVADPTLQLGDRITIVDATGNKINEDQQIASINIVFTAGENDAFLTQILTTRPV